MTEQTYDHCQNCSKVGDIAACNNTPCEFRGSWYIRFLKERCGQTSETIRQVLLGMDPNVDYPHLSPAELAIVYNLKKGNVENLKESDTKVINALTIVKGERELKLIEALFSLDGFVIIGDDGLAHIETKHVD